MMKMTLHNLLLAMLLAFNLTSCAGFTAYVQQHAAGIAAFTAGAGAVAVSEQVVVNALEIKNEIKEQKK